MTKSHALPAAQGGTRTPSGSPATSIETRIAKGVDTYIRSIDLADTKLGATVFSTAPEVSFIHPRGHERGWTEVAGNFYGKTMGETFTQRTLKRVSDLTVHVYGNAAVAEFDWDFVATRRDNGQPLHTTGRESQVWVNLPKQGWRIVQVHYSGPPQTGTGQGF